MRVLLAAKVEPLSRPNAVLAAVVAVLCFRLAYLPGLPTVSRLGVFGYAICLVLLARLPSARQAFYFGLFVGFAIFSTELTFFGDLFGFGAIVLWLILAFWIALFTTLARLTLTRFGAPLTALLLPSVWTGLEYFRSELYHLKFSWLNIGYALSGWEERLLPFVGMYGVGFLVVTVASVWLALRPAFAAAILVLGLLALLLFGRPNTENPSASPDLRIAGVQLEFPSENQILSSLDNLHAAHADANLVVLSEYTFDGPVPDSLKAWCRKTGCYLIVGGKDPAAGGTYFNTAFVVNPTGEIVFRQAKSVPIPFFNDGLPAPQQSVWNSPWGKIGIGICFDLSFARVTDELVRQGAQLLVVPTMDVAEWGGQEHRANARVAPVRAAEYGVPIFRLGSSGISEAIDCRGQILGQAAFPGQGEMLFAAFHLPTHGTLPCDRWLAPASVGIVALLLLVHILMPWMKRKPR